MDLQIAEAMSLCLQPCRCAGPKRDGRWQEGIHWIQLRWWSHSWVIRVIQLIGTHFKNNSLFKLIFLALRLIFNHFVERICSKLDGKHIEFSVYWSKKQNSGSSYVVKEKTPKEIFSHFPPLASACAWLTFNWLLSGIILVILDTFTSYSRRMIHVLIFSLHLASIFIYCTWKAADS